VDEREDDNSLSLRGVIHHGSATIVNTTFHLAMYLVMEAGECGGGEGENVCTICDTLEDVTED
jgi:hypothetical protein